MHPLYGEWIKYVFDRPLTPCGWYFDIEYTDFEASEEDIAILFVDTMENCGTDLARFSDAQVNFGLHYIFNNSCSNIVFSLMSANVSIELRLLAIGSISALYNNCFAKRCSPVLGYIDEVGANPINEICYVLWDASPLSYWEQEPNKDIFYRAVVKVLEKALLSSNPACVESALHGLGHIYSSYNHTSIVIEKYLQQGKFVHPELFNYAKQAKTGNIQ